MKVSKIVFPRVLQTEERSAGAVGPEQVKIKVTSALLTNCEYSAYRGNEDLKYPIVPGRFAVGIVVEKGENCFGVDKNTRVCLNGVTAMGNNEDQQLLFAGADTDGFLCDFAVLDEDKLSPLPSSVSDREAVFAEMLALCEAVADKIDAGKGKHIAVVGATALGVILCQLLIYHQAVPILIDTDPDKLEAAGKTGIYYTLQADETLIENISQLTGGRMASAGIYLNDSRLAPELAFTVTRSGKNVVFAGFTPPERNISLKEVFCKNLNVFSVNNGYSYVSAAINLLVNKAVNPLVFECSVITQPELEATLTEGANMLDSGKYPPCVILNKM